MEDNAFKTFESEGRVMHPIGLIQICQRGYIDNKHFMQDPPPFTDTFRAWLDDHDTTIVDFGAFGPIHLSFPSETVAEEFRVEWHEPGVALHLEYLASDESKERMRKNMEVINNWQIKNI